MGRGPFLFAAGACFPRGGDRASSCLRGLASPPIPLESSAFRFNALFGSECGIGGGGLHHDILLIVLRMVLSIPILSKGGVGRGPFLFAAGACFPAGRRSRPLVPGGSRFSFYSAGVDRISIHSFGFEFGSGRGLDFIELFMYR